MQLIADPPTPPCRNGEEKNPLLIYHFEAQARYLCEEWEMEALAKNVYLHAVPACVTQSKNIRLLLHAETPPETCLLACPGKRVSRSVQSG